MKLVTIDTGRGGTAGALLPSNEVLNFAKAALPDGPEAWIPASVRDLLEAGPQGLDVARGLVARVHGDAAR
jgi:acylpyruvate hydrolase